MVKYFEINKSGQNIRCKMYYNKNTDIRKAVLCLHGFAGHKDNSAAQKFAERVLDKCKGTAVLTFNLPCHGDDVKKKPVLSDFMTYIELTVDYIKNSLNAEEIYAYATSFGGYLVLKYISDFENPFTKIALRCPAVNMAETLTNRIMKNDELSLLKKGKPVQVGFDRKVSVTQSFLDELAVSDIRNTDFLQYAENIIILHGTKDEVVSFDTVRSFADNNIIEFIPVENADHRFQNPACMETATKTVLSFFSL